MTTLEQIIAAAQMLPPADRHSLRQWLQEQEHCDAAAAPPAAETMKRPDNGARPVAAPPRATETVAQQVERFRKAMNWIKEHRAEYLGQWVVLVGDQLISHGCDSRQVVEEARAAGIATPFMALVREEPKAFMSGLL